MYIGVNFSRVRISIRDSSKKDPPENRRNLPPECTVPFFGKTVLHSVSRLGDVTRVAGMRLRRHHDRHPMAQTWP